jgi:hypothetical protein
VKQLREGPTSQLDTATFCKLAPGLSLIWLSSKTVRLSDFHRKTSIVLVFVYGDT